ncbi:MAG: hypothetical protein NTZ82_06750 [Bacteroidetes bacterium]|nr:hypothetical protein [Bacteroidota bacterium]
MSTKLIFFFTLFIVQTSHSQVGSFQKNMEEAVAFFDQAKTQDQTTVAFSKMEALYKMDPTQWLPAYYATLIKARMSIKKMGNPDMLADEALAWLMKTKALHNSDEVACIESFAYTAKMAVSPTFRWNSYDKKIKNPLAVALGLNKNNPRIYTLQASLLFRMPGWFGGGCKSALPLAQKAKLIFDAQKNDFTVMPHWGRPIINEILNGCPVSE